MTSKLPPRLTLLDNAFPIEVSASPEEPVKFYQELTSAIQESANKAQLEAAMKIRTLENERDYYKRLAESYDKKLFLLDEWPGDIELMQPRLTKDEERREFLKRLK